MTSMRPWMSGTTPRSFSLSDNWPRRKLKILLRNTPTLTKEKNLNQLTAVLDWEARAIRMLLRSMSKNLLLALVIPLQILLLISARVLVILQVRSLLLISLKKKKR